MKRPNQHVLEDKSRNYVNNLVTNKGWVYRDRQKDYGIDADFQIVRDGRVTGEIIFAQLKGIGRYADECATTIRVRCKVAHVLYWLSLPVPVVLVAYIDAVQQAYWVCVQQYVASILDEENPRWSEKKSVSIHLPITSILSKTLDDIGSLPSQYVAISRPTAVISDTGAESSPPLNFIDQLVELLNQRQPYEVLADIVSRLNSIERGILELRNTRIVRRHFENYVRAETLEEFGVDDAAGIAKVFLEPSIRSRFRAMKMPRDALTIRISRNLKRITFTSGNESWSISRPERLLECSCRYTATEECPLHSKISPERFSTLWERPVEIQHLGTRVVYQGAPKYPAAWPPSLESLKFGTIIAQLPKMNGGRVIDVGCGTGYLGLLAVELLLCDEVTFVDWMPSALVMASINLARSRAFRRPDSRLRAGIVCSDGLRSLCDQGARFELLLCNPPFMPDLGVAEMRTLHSVFGTDLLIEVLDKAPELADVSIVAYSSLVAKEVEPRLEKLGTRARILNPDGFEMPFSVSYALNNSEYLKLLLSEGRLREFADRRHKLYHTVYFVEVHS